MGSDLIPSLDNSNINWKSIIFGISTVQFTIQSYLKYRQYKSVGQPKHESLPSSSSDSTQDSLLRSPSESLEQDAQDITYTKANLKFKFVNETIDLIQQTVFFTFDLYPRLWSVAGSVLPSVSNVIPYFSGPITQSLLFAGGLFLINFPKSLFSGYYNSFVIQENYGFNKFTTKDWLIKELKTKVGSGVAKLPVIATALKVIDLCKPHLSTYLFHLYIAMAVFGLVVYPNVIVPLIYKSDKLEEGELSDLIRDVAKETGFPLSEIYVLNGSEKSNHSSAFFFGLPFCSQKFFIYDTVIDQVKKDQLRAVLVHEIGHWKLNHTKIRHSLLLVNNALLFKIFGSLIYNKSLYSSFKFGEETPTIVGSNLFNYIYSFVQFSFNYCFNMAVRSGIYSADKYAVGLGYGKELSSTLVVARNQSFNHLNNDPFYSISEDDQPDVQDRIDRINVALKASNYKKT